MLLTAPGASDRSMYVGGYPTYSSLDVTVMRRWLNQIKMEYEGREHPSDYPI